MLWAGDVDDLALEERARQEVRRLEEEGTPVAFIPFGGSSSIAAHGYADCGDELKVQAPNLAHVFTAVGSGGTMAGLVHSLGGTRVHGVDAGAVSDPEQRVRALISAMAKEDYSEPLSIRGDQVGLGYAYLTEPVEEALQLVARYGGSFWIPSIPVAHSRALSQPFERDL